MDLMTLDLTIPDIDNPDALRKYYDLLHSVLRVIVSAVFSRGLHNEQMMEQTRAFLAENRQCMVGIFKRVAKIGGAGTSDHHSALGDLANSYVALIAATNFLEVCIATDNMKYLFTNIPFSLRIVKSRSQWAQTFSPERNGIQRFFFLVEYWSVVPGIDAYEYIKQGVATWSPSSHLEMGE